jgi:hypothetical protein
MADKRRSEDLRTYDSSNAMTRAAKLAMFRQRLAARLQTLSFVERLSRMSSKIPVLPLNPELLTGSLKHKSSGGQFAAALLALILMFGNSVSGGAGSGGSPNGHESAKGFRMRISSKAGRTNVGWKSHPAH